VTELVNYWNLNGRLNVGPYPASQELQFSLSDLDNEDRFNSLPPSNWTRDSFTYKYNSHGFRSREFTPANNILLTLGCSHTVGVGVPFETTWGEQLAQHFPNLVVYNGGVGGAGADTVTRMAVNLIPILKPAMVAILWPNLHRFESYHHGAAQNDTRYNGPWETDNLQFQFEDNTIYNNQTKNKLIVQLLQTIYKFDLVEMEIDKINAKHYRTQFPTGRDQMHYGTEWHSLIGEEFYKEYASK